MTFGVLALDYDGTITRDGWLDPEVRSAIMVAVVLVTGHILAKLRQFVGDLHFVDAVVAENGTLLSFRNGKTRLLGHPAPGALLEELRRRGVPSTAGQCAIETDAVCAQRAGKELR